MYVVYLEVSDVRQAQDQLRALSRHEQAGQCINLSNDRFKVQAARQGALPPAGPGKAGAWFEVDSAD